ncbi:MAG TPA: HD domain-containing phosphohydrolase, partial [Phycisphaerae bacterium]|nr:HD domain-containing phosphohydrolase [Phycisphaerae bacterium]
MNAIHELPLESLAALMDALNFGAILIDQAGAIIHANERICTMLGRHRSDVLGRSLESLYVAPDDVAFARRCVEEFDAAFEEEFHLSTPDHTPVPAIVASRPLGDTRLAAPLYKLITAMDIGRLKKMEGRLTEDYQEIAKLSDTVLAQAIDLKHYSEHLEQKVRERTTDLFDANMDAIYMLAVASEAKDQDTGAHVQRIRRYTELLASEIGLPPATLEQYGYSAVLHDVGKMSVPDHVLKKPGPLSADERKIIQGHTTAGEHILGERPFFELARRIARSHHENWNGSGYPDR